MLLTQETSRSRSRYLNARNTLFTLLDLAVLPIINENDTVAVEEIKFGDNDNLVGAGGHLVEADLLVILTDMDGLYTADPRQDPTARLSPRAPAGQLNVLWPPIGSRHRHRRNGDKVQAARRAAASGIPTIIANGCGRECSRHPSWRDGRHRASRPRRPDAEPEALARLCQPATGAITVDAWRARQALVRAARACCPRAIRLRPAGRSGPATWSACCDPDGGSSPGDWPTTTPSKWSGLRASRAARSSSARATKPYDEVVHRDNLVILELMTGQVRGAKCASGELRPFTSSVGVEAGRNPALGLPSLSMGSERRWTCGRCVRELAAWAARAAARGAGRDLHRGEERAALRADGATALWNATGTRSWQRTSTTWADAKSEAPSAGLRRSADPDDARVEAMAAGVRQVAELPDPVGEITGMWRRPNGLQIGRMRVPLGVIGVIYESTAQRDRRRGRPLPEVGERRDLAGRAEAIRTNRRHRRAPGGRRCIERSARKRCVAFIDSGPGGGHGPAAAHAARST